MDKAERAGYALMVEIASLRDVPRYLPTVADRIWQAWWKADGYVLSDVETSLVEVSAAAAFPFTLVATDKGRFLGTVTAIQSDIAERPEFGPCLAALWVEPEVRGQGIAERLTTALLARLSELGYARVYLSAKPRMRGFYQSRGWSAVESDVGAEGLDVFVRALP